MARIEDLVSEIQDPRLRLAIAEELAQLKARKQFGLVFEEHLPEYARLFGAKLYKGALVVRRDVEGNQIFKIAALSRDRARIAPVIGGADINIDQKKLCLVRPFGEPIYPSLRLIEEVRRSDETHTHAVICADNFHALQTLRYTCEGSVDVIYIDPPYNTGAKAWKYNNDFVDANDQWRHSKWLSMMKRRLQLSKRLLSQDGVLIVTIDENELATLGLLLKELFPSHEITPVSIVHNPRGIQGDNFSFCHETAYFVIPAGKKLIARRALSREDIDPNPLRKWGKDSERATAATCFYPIYFKDGKYAGVGPVPKKDFHPKAAYRKLSDGRYEFWPLDNSGVERKWRYSRDSIEEVCDQLSIEERDGVLQVILSKDTGQYKTVWTSPSFDASSNGKRLLGKFVNTDFPYPKSLYAVQECLRAAVGGKKNAVILDFFAGSGTTLHATLLLNAEERTKHRCILVTNNEVGALKAKELSERKVFPGDPVYERHGICESTTWPRCKRVVTGLDVDLEPIQGKYRSGRRIADGFKENLAYFRLEFQDPNDVARGDCFDTIHPLLWLMVGARGSARAPEHPKGWFVRADSGYGVLLKEEEYRTFVERVRELGQISHLFFITDSPEAFAEMAEPFLRDKTCVHLYRSYLENFKINISTNA